MKSVLAIGIVFLLGACRSQAPVVVYTPDRAMGAAEARTFIYPTPKCVNSAAGQNCTHY